MQENYLVATVREKKWRDFFFFFSEGEDQKLSSPLRSKAACDSIIETFKAPEYPACRTPWLDY